MKSAVLIALVALAGLCQASPAPRNDCALQGHVQDLIALIDTEKVAALLYSSLDDPDMQNLFAFLFSPDFRQLYLDVAAQPEVIQFIAYLEANCVNVTRILDYIRDYLEIGPRSAGVKVARNGVAAFWESLLEIVPLAEIRALAEHKYANYPEFAEAVDRLRSEQTYQLFLQLRENETYQRIVHALASLGIDVDRIRDVLGALLLWN